MGLEYLSNRKLVNALVSDLGLEFSTRRGERPSLKRIVMPELEYGTTQQQQDAWFSALLDEAYFRMPSMRKDLQFLQGSENLSPNMEGLYTELLRSKAHTQRHGILLGADEYSEKSYEQYINTTDGSAGRDAQRMFEATARQMSGVSSHTYSMSEHTLSPEAKALYDKAKHLLPRYIDQSLSEQENYETARELTSILFNEENQSAEQQAANQAAKQQGQTGDDGSPTDEDGKTGEGEGEEPREGEQEEGENHQPKRDNDVKGVSQKVTFEATDTGNEISLLETQWHSPEGANAMRDIRRQIEGNPLRLSHKVANLMRIMSQAKYVGGHKMGRINKRRIATVPSGNERVFRKKHQANILDTAVYLLVDSSGSMSGTRYGCAATAAIAMSEALTQVHIPHAISGFTYWGRKNRMYSHAKFGVPVNKESLIKSMAGVDLCGNSDGEALLEAFDDIRAQKQRRKIIIVLSDGQPADGSNPDSLLKKVAADIEKSPVELYAIGIETTTPRNYYKNVTVIKHNNELEEALMGLLKKTIIN